VERESLSKYVLGGLMIETLKKVLIWIFLWKLFTNYF